MSEAASISTGVSARYAQAVIDLAREADATERLGSDVRDLQAAIEASSDLRALLVSPVATREEGRAAIEAIAGKMGLDAMLTNTLALMASKRRLFVVPAMLSTLRAMMADERGETTAEVRAPKALSDAQAARLTEALKASTGRDVALDVTVDESLIGGLVVQIGSRMIDTSVRARLDAMQNTMREAR